MRSVLLYLAVTATLSAAAVPQCTNTCTHTVVGDASGLVNTCVGENAVFSCKNGPLNSTSAEGVPISFERATCVKGIWFGTTCTGAVFVPAVVPAFSCEVPTVPTTAEPTTGPTTAPPTTTEPTTGPTTAPPTTAEPEPTGPCDGGVYVSTGPANSKPIRSSCNNGENQVLECDDEKIYITLGDAVLNFETVSFLNGSWYGMTCGGSLTALGSDVLYAQCGVNETIPSCLSVPTIAELKWVTTSSSGLAHFGCPHDQILQVTANISTTTTIITGYYIQCSDTVVKIATEKGQVFESTDITIISTSCRDPGSFNKVCAVPWTVNAIRKNGKLRCEKGYFPNKMVYLNATNTEVTLEGAAISSITGVSCEEDGWSIDGLSISGVQVTGFQCAKAEVSGIGKDCPAIKITERNVDVDVTQGTYKCASNKETLTVIDVTGAKSEGSKLKCVSNQWKLSGASEVVVTAGSTVSCIPANCPMLPPKTIDLVFAGIAIDGFLRWTCPGDRTLVLSVASDLANDDQLQTLHAVYIEVGAGQYRLFSDSGVTSNIFTLMSNVIFSATCEDLGPRYPGVTNPQACNAVRSKKYYKCKKGYYLDHIEFDDHKERGQKYYGKDFKGMTRIRCGKGGWTPKGHDRTQMRITKFVCKPVTIEIAGASCSATISFAKYLLSFDAYEKKYACHKGEKLGYTVGTSTEVIFGSGSMNVFCGKNASGAFEWQWSKKDGSSIEALPAGAKLTCVKDDNKPSSKEKHDSGSSED